MKLKSLFLIAIAFLVAALLPLINMSQGNITRANLSSVKLTIAAAYKTDYITGWANLVRSKVGYSSSPSQAVIGTNGWMYLGDQYAKSITVNRGMLVPEEKNYETAKKRRMFIRDYAKDAGAQGTYFMIAPNKESVYPDNLPEWAKAHGKPTFSGRLLKENDETLINLLPAMRSAKAKHSQPIYLKTDSHWNSIGAWEAYKEVSKIISHDIPEFKFLSDADIKNDLDRQGTGGDISAFLFMNNLITDSRPSITPYPEILIEISDIETGKKLYKGKNTPTNSYDNPTLVKSATALNKARVLWFRDSFGTAISPFMAATFSETIQQHWNKVIHNDKALKQLIDTHRPDLVLFTIVERNYFSVVNNYK